MKSSLLRAATLPKAKTKEPTPLPPPPLHIPPDTGRSRDQAPTLPEKIAGHLQRSILSGEWTEGQALPSETALAQAFSTNRVSLRQAMQIVKTSGLIEGGQGRSWKVSSLWKNLAIGLLPELIEARGLRPEIVQIVEDYLALRTPLLGWVAVQAAHVKASGSSLQGIDGKEAMKAALRDIEAKLASDAPPSELFLADFAWFEALIEASGSLFVQAMLRPLGQIYRRFAPFVGLLWEPTPAYPAALHAIQAAVFAGDAAEAQSLLQTYLESERLRLLERLHLATSSLSLLEAF